MPEYSKQLQLFSMSLKLERKKRKLTKTQLANATGITRERQSEYEKGRCYPCVGYLIKLSEMGFEFNGINVSNSGASSSSDEAVLNLYRNANPTCQLEALRILADGLLHQQSTCHNSAVIAGKQTIISNHSKTITTIILVS